MAPAILPGADPELNRLRAATREPNPSQLEAQGMVAANLECGTLESAEWLQKMGRNSKPENHGLNNGSVRLFKASRILTFLY